MSEGMNQDELKSVTQDVTTPEPPEDALTARIAELEAPQRWIPVSEPPKVSGKYLLLNIYDDVYPCDFIAGTETWVVHDFAMFTHWMPLPQLRWRSVRDEQVFQFCNRPN